MDEDERSRKKIGRPVADTDPIMVRMSRQMIKDLDDARRHIDDLPTRPELIRRILADWLATHHKG